MLSTSIFMCQAKLAKAVTNDDNDNHPQISAVVTMPANQIQSSNPETAPTSKLPVPNQPTTEQPSANSNPTTSNDAESNKPAAPTEQSKQLNSQYYKVNSQQVYVTNGQSVT